MDALSVLNRITDHFDRFDNFLEQNDFFNEIRTFASDRPLLLYAAYNWHEHLVLGGNSATFQLMKQRYNRILDVSKPDFWVWFLPISTYICTKISHQTSAISSVWETPAKAYSMKSAFGQLLREDCLANLFSMDDSLYLLLGSRSLPKSADPESLEKTQQGLIIRYSSSQTDQPQWKATEGYDLIDKFHVASGEYEFTAASQAVVALEEGHEERGIALAERVPKSTLFWTCVTKNNQKALRKTLASVHDTKWLHEVPDHFVCSKAPGNWNMISILGPLGTRERKERHDNLIRRWPPASVVMFKAHKEHSSKTGNLFEVLADWIEASSHPSHNAQELWEAGGFFDPSLCSRLVGSGVSVDRKMWRDDRTALQCAAALWEHDLIQVLIGLGADPAIRASNGYNALHLFLIPEDTFPENDSSFPGMLTDPMRRRMGGNPRFEKRRITASIKAFARSSTVGAPLNDGITPLMLAARYSATATKDLLAEQADPAQRDEKGRTALMHIFVKGFNGRPVRILKYLLDSGADSLALDSRNRTVLGYWAYPLLRQDLRLLYPGSNSFNKAFHQLASNGPLSRRDVLIKQLASLKIPLVIAACLGNAELCWALMDSGAHPDEHGVPKDSPIGHDSGSLSMELEDIAWNPVMVALHSKAYTTAAIILAYGANVDFQTPKPKRTRYSKYRLATVGMTPLHIAIRGDSNYNSHQSISLGRSGINTCAFSVATHPDHLVSGVSGMEILAKSETQRLAELEDMDDNVPSSEVSKTCKLQMLCCETCRKANQR